MKYGRLNPSGYVLETFTPVNDMTGEPVSLYQAFPTSLAIQFEEIPDNVEAGWALVEGEWVEPPPKPPVEEAPSKTKWLIDVGPFFDRFGAAKMAVLASTHNTVKAIVQDVMVRKWIDLQRQDVGQGIDALIALGVPGVTAELKNYILTTPVTAEENLAVRTTYFKE
jgi:hypothetical protein